MSQSSNMAWTAQQPSNYNGDSGLSTTATTSAFRIFCVRVKMCAHCVHKCLYMYHSIYNVIFVAGVAQNSIVAFVLKSDRAQFSLSQCIQKIYRQCASAPMPMRSALEIERSGKVKNVCYELKLPADTLLFSAKWMIYGMIISLRLKVRTLASDFKSIRFSLVEHKTASIQYCITVDGIYWYPFYLIR